jgi:hypothetical protein
LKKSTPTEINTEFNKRHEEWRKNQEEIISINCTSLPEYHKVLKNWLYLGKDDLEFINVGLAALLDREIPGDPVWLYLIAPPGGLKSELLRAFREYPRAYTLDTLTPATFVSGLMEKDKETGDRKPVAGILQDLNGKTLIIKDFTTILNSSDETKTAIYGQLRSIYDGYFEKAFGTSREKISVTSIIGLLVGVTPIIDKYTRMHSALGERFLKIRSEPDYRRAAERALQNEGKETQMRAELAKATSTLLSNLDFSVVPVISEEYELDILRMAMYVAYMRANVWVSYQNGSIVEMEIIGSEVPTRLAKQFKHLVKLLAIVRDHKSVMEHDMQTLGRVARNTAEQKKQAIVDHFVTNDRRLELGFHRDDIAGHSKKLYKTNVSNHMSVLEALDCVTQEDDGRYWLTDHFKEFVWAVYRLTPYHFTKEAQKRLV